jgi:polyadenylate-binding protein
VKYADPDSAAAAIKRMNGRLVDGKTLEVRAAGVPPSVPNPSVHSVSEACSVPSKEVDTSNLYIGNLPLSMDELKLLEHFLPFGKVTNIKVPRDHSSGLSKGYGFVKYSDSHHAAKAITHLNGVLVEGRKMEVRVAVSPSTLSNSAVGSQTIKEIDMANLYVCNIHASIDTNKLVELFLPFGKITHARVAASQLTSGNGYGFVRFDDPQCADEAIAVMNGSLIEGENLTVRVAGLSSSASSSAVQGSPPEINKSRLYVTNLPRSMNADKLVSLFVPFGQISKVVIHVEYSLVYYADVTSAITAIKNMDGYLIEGKRLAVRRYDFCPSQTNAAEHALSQSADNPMKEIDMANLYVGSIPPVVTADQLVELFRPFGQIVQSRLFHHKGYGMVRYGSSLSAAAAIDHMDGYQIGGSALVVRVAGLPNPGDYGAATNALTPHMPGNEQRQVDMSNLYVCRLPLYITTEKLVEIFLSCGPITQAKVVVDRYTGVSKGFGFVKFADTYGAAVALTHMNGYPLEGHILEVRIAGVHPGAMSGYMTYLYSQLTYPDPSIMAVGVPTSYWPYYCAESAYATSAENQGPATDASSQTSQQEGFRESMSLSPVTEKDCSSSVSSHATNTSQPQSSAGRAGPPGFEQFAVRSHPPSLGWAGPPGFAPHTVLSPKKDLGAVMNPSQHCSKVHLAQSEGGQKRRSIV